MSRRPVHRIVRAVTDRLWERDQRQMRAIDALLLAVERRRRRPKRPRHRASIERTR
jgi:hypothetical protein